VPAATWLARRLTARGAYAAALALLAAVARRPATRRVVTVVTVASALRVFSTYAVSVGGRNRQLAAQRDNGAPMVADLTGTNVARAQSALAGIGGGHATPVVRVAGDKSFRTTLAVEPEAFGRIALLPDADPAVLRSQLRVPTAPAGPDWRGRLAAGDRGLVPGRQRLRRPPAAPADRRGRRPEERRPGADPDRRIGDPARRALPGRLHGRPARRPAYFGTGYGGRLTISTSASRPHRPAGSTADWRPACGRQPRRGGRRAPGTLAVRMSNDGKTSRADLPCSAFSRP
jgi:hypothetical protein